jgi:processive 1,2-diacylglycerol beta-glucosyltransferase
VSTHFLATSVLGRMRLRGELHAPLVTVVTDEHPHAAWIHPGSDATCVASPAAREAAIAAGLRPDAVHATGIPIDPRFCMVQPCGLDGADGAAGVRPTVLVCGGGYGLGGIDQAVASLLAMGIPADIVVVCGKNADLEHALRAVAARRAAPVRQTILPMKPTTSPFMADVEISELFLR